MWQNTPGRPDKMLNVFWRTANTKWLYLPLGVINVINGRECLVKQVCQKPHLVSILVSILLKTMALLKVSFTLGSGWTSLKALSTRQVFTTSRGEPEELV